MSLSQAGKGGGSDSERCSPGVVVTAQEAERERMHVGTYPNWHYLPCEDTAQTFDTFSSHAAKVNFQ